MQTYTLSFGLRFIVALLFARNGGSLFTEHNCSLVHRTFSNSPMPTVNSVSSPSRSVCVCELPAFLTYYRPFHLDHNQQISENVMMCVEWCSCFGTHHALTYSRLLLLGTNCSMPGHRARKDSSPHHVGWMRSRLREFEAQTGSCK